MERASLVAELAALRHAVRIVIFLRPQRTRKLRCGAWGSGVEVADSEAGEMSTVLSADFSKSRLYNGCRDLT